MYMAAAVAAAMAEEVREDATENFLSALDASIDGPSGLGLIDTYSCCRCCHCQLHSGVG